MSKFLQALEFISYTPTPEDGLQMGVATIKVKGDVPIMLRFKWIQKKDGNGIFPASGSVCVTRGEKKEYLSCADLDSKSDNELLREFLRENINREIMGASFSQSHSGAVTQAYGMAKPSTNSATNDNLPF